MKKRMLLLMTEAIVALASCSQADEMPMQPQEEGQLATFTIEAPGTTRAAVNNLTRYIVEAYEGSSATDAPVAREESASTSLTLTLKKNTDYTFLFWADRGTAKTEATPSSGYWNTDDLKAVTVTTGKESEVGEVAYCLATTFNSKDFEAKKNVTLKNATAQVNFVETDGLVTENNTLAVRYDVNNTELNVGTGKVKDIIGFATHTFTGIEKAAKDAILATDYLLAPLGEERLLNLTITFNNEAPKDFTNVPFEQSYKTNIKGEYSVFGTFTFELTADDAWETPEKDEDLDQPVI